MAEISRNWSNERTGHVASKKSIDKMMIRLVFFPVCPIVRDSHHHKSPTRREQDLNMRRNWVQALLNEVCWMKLYGSDNDYTTGLLT